MAKVVRYMIRAGEAANPSRRRVLAKEFVSRREAQQYLDRLLAPGKVNPGGARRTAFRDALSGSGIHNPRIVKRMVNR